MSDIDGLVDEVFGDLITDEDALDRSEEGGTLSAARLLPSARLGFASAVLESADLDIRTCQHELAYAIAALSGVDVALFPPRPEHTAYARTVRDMIATFPRCQLKGAS